MENTNPEHTNSVTCLLQVALPLPLPQLFDYLPPSSQQATVYSGQMQPGQRVLVPFGNRELVGIVVNVTQTGEFSTENLKAVIQFLEHEPSLPSELLNLCQWAANYYHHPLGEVLSAALPLRYRKQEAREDLRTPVWMHTTEGLGLPETALKRSKKQQLLHQYLLQHRHIGAEECARLDISTAVCKALADKGLIHTIMLESEVNTHTEALLSSAGLTLNNEQQAALKSLRYHQFQSYLLHSVTGSGKTEVYMQIIARVLETGKQALVLIPEIGLTPQTLARFHQRFQVQIAELHSRVSEVERARNWEKARSGHARIVIGTRLAALTPLKAAGVIIVDEEHDASYKQQDGFRYSARDISIYRAHQLNIPIVLGSATPSLESLHNALSGRYQYLHLQSRAGVAKPPKLQTIDLRAQAVTAGISNEALSAIEQTIRQGQQALVFINRRGYAPVLFCAHCGWSARCPSCELNFTLHQQPPRLHCHHCDSRRAVPQSCPNCKHPNLQHSGAGTEQVVEFLDKHFSQVPVVRIDRDTTRNKDSMEKLLAEANEGKACILVGTQMLAKGHHLPGLTLVVVLDTDQGLMSPDYKALERLGQLLTQVSGRAGREQVEGKVLLQSLQPEHPLLQTLINEGYEAFAQQLLQTRQHAHLPPYTYSALFRAESKRGENALELLAFIKRELLRQQTASSQTPLKILGPFPALIEKLNHRYRYQLQIYCADRRKLHTALDSCLPPIYQNALSRRTRWSIDIDPADHL